MGLWILDRRKSKCKSHGEREHALFIFKEKKEIGVNHRFHRRKYLEVRLQGFLYPFNKPARCHCDKTTLIDINKVMPSWNLLFVN